MTGRTLPPEEVHIAIIRPVLAAGIGYGVLNVAPSLFDLALHLLGCALSLGILVACPLADLAFHAASHIVNLTLNAIAIHVIASQCSCGFIAFPAQARCTDLVRL